MYLSPLFLDRSEEHIRFTMAHEIAHAVLSDAEVNPQDAGDESKRAERDADAITECWGFKRPSTITAV